MKKIILIIALFVSLQASAHTDSLEVSPAPAKYVIQNIAQHGKMVSFTTWSLNEIEPLFTYLSTYLNYGTAYNFIEKPFGYSLTAESINNKKLKFDFYCKPNSKVSTKVIITGSNDNLIELYLRYFEGHATSINKSEKGILEEKIIYHDKVQLYSNKIVIDNIKF